MAGAKGLPYHPCAGKTPDCQISIPVLEKKMEEMSDVWNVHCLSPPRFEAWMLAPRFEAMLWYRGSVISHILMIGDQGSKSHDWRYPVDKVFRIQKDAYACICQMPLFSTCSEDTIQYWSRQTKSCQIYHVESSASRSLMGPKKCGNTICLFLHTHTQTYIHESLITNLYMICTYMSNCIYLGRWQV